MVPSEQVARVLMPRSTPTIFSLAGHCLISSSIWMETNQRPACLDKVADSGIAPEGRWSVS